ncbi:MAG: hypothetical protein WAW17_30995 [Rhodococcus sp. (in: high G+C Gram-positive bacteria)]|uniref:hypothetical protein n=1 Tax=Rhodococcus sp. TaxID=1831 RepID=UPI003BB10DE8
MLGGYFEEGRVRAVPACAVLMVGLLASGCAQSIEGRAAASAGAAERIPASSAADAVGVPGPATPTGWQPVAAKRGLTYDVPPDWNVYSPGTLIGWENDEGPIRTMSGASELKSVACSEHSRALAGVAGSGTVDLTAAAQADAAAVESIFTSESGRVPEVILSAPREFSVSGHPAVEISATVRNIEQEDGCTAPSARYTVITTTSETEPDTVVFIVTTDQGVSDAPDTGLAAKIVSTLRRSEN